MAGIYIHIPFCKRLCSYCDFYRSNQLGYKHELLQCLLIEIDKRYQYLEDEKIETIYFGGGTPSILNESEINKILKKIEGYFTIAENAEITLEVNPDDLTPDYLHSLKNETIVNRLSIGVQTFIDRDLIVLNRRHTAGDAINAVHNAEKAGFDNIGIDLIYGIPGMTTDDWISNLTKAFNLNISHLSAYHLTYELNTPMYELKKKKQIIPVDEEESIRQFRILIEKADREHFEHYEISNFAKQKKYSRHNTNYWKGEKYLGIGPSAHSYNKVTRQWNIADNLKYIHCISEGEIFYEIEELDVKARFNEYIMTGLRTQWGINLTDIKVLYGNDYYIHTQKQALPFIKQGKLHQNNQTISLSNDGKLIADYIISKLFL